MTTAFYEDTAEIVADPFDPLWRMDEEIWEKGGALGEYLSHARDLADENIKYTDYGYSVFQMKMHQFSFVYAGLYAYKIKVSKEYKEHYPTFANFCTRELGYSPWQVNNLINGARVVNELICQGFDILPKNEAQTRELRGYFESELADIWSKVTEAMPHHKITAKSIKEIKTLGKEKQEIDDPTVKQEMSVEAFHYLQEEARYHNVSRMEMLNIILIPDYKSETIDPDEKMMKAMAKCIQTLGGFDETMKKVKAIY